MAADQVLRTFGSVGPVSKTLSNDMKALTGAMLKIRASEIDGTHLEDEGQQD